MRKEEILLLPFPEETEISLGTCREVELRNIVFALFEANPEHELVGKERHVIHVGTKVNSVTECSVFSNFNRHLQIFAVVTDIEEFDKFTGISDESAFEYRRLASLFVGGAACKQQCRQDGCY